MKRLRISDRIPGPRNSSFNSEAHCALRLISLRLYRDDSGAIGRREKWIYFGIYLSKGRVCGSVLLVPEIGSWDGTALGEEDVERKRERIVWATSPLIDATAEAVQTQAKCSNMKALILRILLISSEVELTLVTGGALQILVYSCLYLLQNLFLRFFLKVYFDLCTF
jgi:hypothetical protein